MLSNEDIFISVFAIIYLVQLIPGIEIMENKTSEEIPLCSISLTSNCCFHKCSSESGTSFGPCGDFSRIKSNFVLFSLEELQSAEETIKQLKKNFNLKSFDTPLTEFELIMNRSGIKMDTVEMRKYGPAICARHRYSFGSSWRPPKTCAFPGAHCKEKKLRTASYAITSAMWQKFGSSEFAVGSGLCRRHRDLKSINDYQLDPFPTEEDGDNDYTELNCSLLMTEDAIQETPPLRKSTRMTQKAQKEEEKKNHIISQVINKVEDGLKIENFEDKGRGIVSLKKFKKGDFIVEYAGDIIGSKEAKRREEQYAKKECGCYMYYFTATGKKYCVDATIETGRFGRLFNHSKKNPNCYTKVVLIPNRNDQPDFRLVLFAKRDIVIGEELTFDYGEKNKNVLEAHPWLKL